MLGAHDYAQEATIDRQLHLAVVVNKAKLSELISEMGIDTRILSIVVFPAALTRPRGRAAWKPFLDARVHHHTGPAG